MTTDRDWITVTTADNESFAVLASERLKEAGIEAVLVPGDASSYMGASSPTEIRVPAELLEKAKQVLA